MTPTFPVVLFALSTAVALVVMYLAFRLAFERWKARYTKQIRKDAVQRSQSVTVGKVYEQLVPYLPDFRWNPKDVRFLGSPVDFVVFDGLSDNDLRAVVFVEVKTGQSTLAPRERLVRDAIVHRRIEWREVSLPGVQ